MAEPKRYPLLLPLSLYRDAQRKAKERDITTAQFIRRCIKWGLMTMPRELVVPDAEGKHE